MVSGLPGDRRMKKKKKKKIFWVSAAARTGSASGNGVIARARPRHGVGEGRDQQDAPAGGSEPSVAVEEPGGRLEAVALPMVPNVITISPCAL